MTVSDGALCSPGGCGIPTPNSRTLLDPHRGQVREGFMADLVIFDDATIIYKATFDKPHQYPEGISLVIVNGQIVFDGQKMTGAMPGMPIYGNGYAGPRNFKIYQ